MWFAETLDVGKSRLGKFMKEKLWISAQESQLTLGGSELNILGGMGSTMSASSLIPCASAYPA